MFLCFPGSSCECFLRLPESSWECFLCLPRISWECFCVCLEATESVFCVYLKQLRVFFVFAWKQLRVFFCVCLQAAESVFCICPEAAESVLHPLSVSILSWECCSVREGNFFTDTNMRWALQRQQSLMRQTRLQSEAIWDLGMENYIFKENMLLGYLSGDIGGWREIWGWRHVANCGGVC